MQGEIWRRSRTMLAMLMGIVDEHQEEESELTLTDWVETVMEIQPESKKPWNAKTVDNTARDLVAFGAVRLVARGRDRLVYLTILGQAWQAKVLLPNIPELPELRAAMMEFFGTDEGDAVDE